MICRNQSNRGPLKKKEKKEEEENKCGSLPTADIVGAVGKMIYNDLIEVLKSLCISENYLTDDSSEYRI